MTLMRRMDYDPVWSGLLGNFWGYPGYSKMERNSESSPGMQVPAVNVKENEDGYTLELAAPGMNKEDFRVEVHNNQLTLSSEKQVQTESGEGTSYSRREFGFQAFTRSFRLPEQVAQDKIEAKYVNGILSVQIPKKEEAKPKPVRSIVVS